MTRAKEEDPVNFEKDPKYTDAEARIAELFAERVSGVHRRVGETGDRQAKRPRLEEGERAEEVTPPRSDDPVQCILDAVRPWLQLGCSWSHDSLPKTIEVPDGGLNDIAKYLPFVGREEATKSLFNCFITHQRQRMAKSSPTREVTFATVCGTAGKGKTTFARRAFYTIRKDEILGDYEPSKKPLAERAFTNIEKSIRLGRNYRLDMGSNFSDWEFEDPPRSLAYRVLYEAVKPKLNQKMSKLETFLAHMHTLGDKTTPRDIYNAALAIHRVDDKEGEEVEDSDDLILLNLDETNNVFGDQKREVYFKNILRTLASYAVQGEAFIFPVLSGTHTLDLYQMVSASGFCIQEIPLRLLTLAECVKVIKLFGICGTEGEDKRKKNRRDGNAGKNSATARF